MEFLKERVYTALNADELKIGSKVIVAFTSGILKNNVLGGIGEGILQKVKSEFETARFVVDGASYSLAYLVSEPEENKLKWTDLKVGDVIRYKSSGVEYLVEGLDKRSIGCHIYAANTWINDESLETKWEKVDYELEEYERRVTE